MPIADHTVRSAETGRRIFTMYTSNDVNSSKDVPFEGFNDKNCSGFKTPKTTKSGRGQTILGLKEEKLKQLYFENNKSEQI